ncbi:TetR/AcrR family transcriptional regulator [Rhodococcoides fascians]|uniref:TetR/AcrR family transcriptional regulator n=1 Tax=Rhodococcoides fascians TaxID=1828 RepID=UPI001E47460A|nr:MULTISPECIES: TetR/AcrR family transcriptional regulator [Rhodococcus]
MKEPQTRNAARTKDAVLTGAARALLAHGSAVTIAAIAEASGVSKGGVLHHFSTKEILIKALAEDFLRQFREDVVRNVDLSENAPGKLLRAYVRTISTHARDLSATTMTESQWGILSLMPEVRAILDADARRWREQFQEDGLHLDRILVVTRAADGLAAAARDEASLTTDEVEHTTAILLRMTFGDGPL